VVPQSLSLHEPLPSISLVSVMHVTFSTLGHPFGLGLFFAFSTLHIISHVSFLLKRKEASFIKKISVITHLSRLIHKKIPHYVLVSLNEGMKWIWEQLYRNFLLISYLRSQEAVICLRFFILALLLNPYL